MTEQVNNDDFAKEITAGCRQAAGFQQITNQHIEIALGGFANLYIEQAHKNDNDIFRCNTEHTFASAQITKEEIIIEIGHCTGYDWQRSEIIFDVMQKIVKDNFERRQLLGAGGQLYFQPIGLLTIIDLDAAQYSLEYRDQCAGHSHLRKNRPKIRNKP